VIGGESAARPARVRPGPAISRRRAGQLYVAAGAIAWSSAGVLQRELHVNVGTQIAGRSLFGLLTLLAFILVQHARGTSRLRRLHWWDLALALCLCVASAAFVIALNHTSVANVLIFQAGSPLIATAISWRLLGEPLTGRVVIAMAVALCGVAIMVGAPSGDSPLGLGLSAVTSASFALVVVIARHRRDVSMAPATCLSQFLLLIGSIPFAQPASVDTHDLVMLVAFGVGQIGVGLALLTIGAQRISAAEISVISLLEVVLGPLWVWLFLAEVPPVATVVGGALVIGAAIMLALSESPDPDPHPHASEPAQDAHP
jgi:drug/metabolite transporter (DMT)-like permease